MLEKIRKLEEEMINMKANLNHHAAAHVRHDEFIEAINHSMNGVHKGASIFFFFANFKRMNTGYASLGF